MSSLVDSAGKFPMEAQCASEAEPVSCVCETSWAWDRMATTVFMHSAQRQGVAEEGRFEVSPQSPLPLECLSEKHLENNKMR